MRQIKYTAVELNAIADKYKQLANEIIKKRETFNVLNIVKIMKS